MAICPKSGFPRFTLISSSLPSRRAARPRRFTSRFFRPAVFGADGAGGDEADVGLEFGAEVEGARDLEGDATSAGDMIA